MQLKQKQYPSKTSVNLVIRERSALQSSRLLLTFLLLAALVALFYKFGVVDRLSAANRAEAEAAAAASRLAQLQQSNAEYESVQVEYARYFSSALTGEETTGADCMEVLALIENQLMSNAGISSASYVSNVLSVQLTGADLDRAAGILAALYRSPLVNTVEIYTADADETLEDGERATLSMTIVLNPKGGEEP